MISLIVHGGAWDIPESELEAHRNGCRTALELGWKMLEAGRPAVDVVEEAIRSLENDESFDAGRGSHLNSAGHVELDASIMDGATLRCGAVAGVRRVRNPVALARRVMDDSEHILLVGDGAEQFAAEHGVALCDPCDLVAERERIRWEALRHREHFTGKDAFRRWDESGDTVGAVAMDSRGNIAAGTSTGGTLNKYPGRVGDSPLIGCGTYADNGAGGVSTTGWGEAIIKVVLAKTVIDLMERNGGDPQFAAEKGIELLKRKVDGHGGVIVLNASGRFGLFYNTPHMARAFRNADMAGPVVAV